MSTTIKTSSEKQFTQIRRFIKKNKVYSTITEENGLHILDLLLAPDGRDIEVYTDFGTYIREASGVVRRK